jgi:hypothetical protein
MNATSSTLRHMNRTVGFRVFAPPNHKRPPVSAFDVVSSVEAMQGGDHEAGAVSTTTKSVRAKESGGGEGYQGARWWHAR